MIELGKMQELTVLRRKNFGIYLGEKEDDEGILLPARQVPEGTAEGDRLTVFVYKDSQDRMIATVKEPLLTLGKMSVLTVKDVTRFGAFLDWGLEKDLFLPFKEQTSPVSTGDRCLVRLYVDKSSRLCATMHVYDYLRANEEYRVGDQVQGTVYRINPEIGAFVAVDNCIYGLVPARELFDDFRMGDTVSARVTGVRADGKLNLSIRDKAYLQMDDDAEAIMSLLEEFGGVLPFGDKADPAVIKRELKMSKNAFKRALGKLYRERKIIPSDTSVRLAEAGDES